jgi:hypothetical protein
MLAFVNAHGGLVPFVLLVVGIANVVLSALSQILISLHLSQPGWVGTIAGFLNSVISFLSANTPSVKSAALPPTP